MKKFLSLILAFLLLFSMILVSANDIAVSFTEAELANWTVFNISNWSGKTVITNDGFLKITHLNPTSNGQSLKPSVGIRYNAGTTLVKGATYTVKYDYKGSNMSGGQQLLFNVGTNKISVSFKSNKDGDAYTAESKNVSEFGYKNDGFWATHNEDYSFTVDDITDAEGKPLKSVSTSNMYLKVNTNGRNDTVNYDDVAFYFGNFSMKETLPEGSSPEKSDEETIDPAYNKVSVIVNETFDGESPLANWSGVVNGSGSAKVEDGAVCVSPVTAQSRIRYEKSIIIKRGAVYTVSYKVKSTSVTSWLFGIEASDKFNGTSTAMYDNGIRNVGAMNTAWQQVSYSFKASSDMETLSTKSIAVFFLFTTAADKVWIDDFKITETIYPDMPEITSASVRGASMANGNVYADCQLKDSDNVLKEISYKWQLSSDNSKWTDVSEEKEYEIPFAAEGKYIRFKAKPSSKATAKEGTEVISDSKKIVSERKIPQISDLKLNVSDGEYTISYTYESDYEEGKTIIYWQYSKDKENWILISDANGNEFTANGTGAGQYVRACVIPADKDGVEGKSYFTSGDETLPSEISFYVSADGSSENPGTITAPFANIEDARNKVRALISNGDTENCDITVYIRGGEYYRTSAFTLTAEDSGNDSHPITYKAYNNEKVTFTGGKTVPEEEIKPVTDESVLSRIYDNTAKSKLLSVDLGKYYSDIPEIPEYSHKNDADGNGFTIFRTQIRPVVNGQALKRAQWPNDDEDELKITAVSEDSTKVTLEKDISDRISRWSDIRYAHAVGHMVAGATWTYQDYKITSVSENSFTIAEKSNYIPSVNGLMKFYDILEEIDCPGESFIDIETKTLYFYPYGDEKPNVVLPVSESLLLSINGAQNINIEGIDFECVRNQIFSLYNDPKNITLKNCSFKHFNAQSSISGYNNTLDGCFAYDGAVGFVSVNGGNPKNVVKGNNAIVNSVLRECGVLKRAYGHTVMLNGFGNMLKNCDIGGADGDLIGTNGMGHRITGCTIHDGTRWTGDMGSVYLGRTPVSIGFEIDHNYFYSHGSLFANGWAQAVFADDGAICPDIHDNIFYKATLATSEGGKNFTIKTNGGQYMNVKNNIFIDNPYAVQFQTWSNAAEMQAYNQKDWQEIKWFLLLFDKYTNNLGWKSTLINNGIIDENYNVSEKWKAYCKGTEWEAYLDILECGFWEEAKELDPKNEEEYEQLKKLAAKYAPNYTNLFTNNAVIEGASSQTGVHDWSRAIDENNYVSLSSKGIFENYGTNFATTESGLAKIQKSAPDFKKIDFEKIGSTSMTDGGKPSVEFGYITAKGNIPSLGYIYKGNIGEGLSKTDWYVSDTENGVFSKITGKHDTILSDDYNGKFVYAEVIPVSRNGNEGKAYKTDTVKIGGNITVDDLLGELIEECKNIESSIGTGSGFCETSGSCHEIFKTAINDATAASDTDEKYKKYESLYKALNTFKESVNNVPGNFESGKNYTVFPFMGSLNIDMPENVTGVTLILPANTELSSVEISGFITLGENRCRTCLSIPEGTVISSGSDFVTLALFGDSETASVIPSNADGEGLRSIKLSSSVYSVSKPLSLIISDASSQKYVGYTEGGKFKNITKTVSDLSGITENSKITVKDGFGIGIVKISEFVIYSKARTADNDDVSGGGNGGTNSGTVSGNPYGNSSSNGFYSTETTNPNLGTETFCFDDMINHWSKTDVMKMFNAGIVSGVSENSFEPDRNITRAEFAAIIARALNLKDAPADYKDVASTDWFAGYVGACTNAGIISGYDGMFRPNDNITRQEMAVVIVNAYSYLNKPAKSGGIDNFTDKDEISDWAKEAVDAASAAGLISGMGDGTFAPRANATRAQAVVVLSNII